MSSPGSNGAQRTGFSALFFSTGPLLPIIFAIAVLLVLFSSCVAYNRLYAVPRRRRLGLDEVADGPNVPWALRSRAWAARNRAAAAAAGLERPVLWDVWIGKARAQVPKGQLSTEKDGKREEMAAVRWDAMVPLSATTRSGTTLARTQVGVIVLMPSPSTFAVSSTGHRPRHGQHDTVHNERNFIPHGTRPLLPTVTECDPTLSVECLPNSNSKGTIVEDHQDMSEDESEAPLGQCIYALGLVDVQIAPSAVS